MIFLDQKYYIQNLEWETAPDFFMQRISMLFDDYDSFIKFLKEMSTPVGIVIFTHDDETVHLQKFVREINGKDVEFFGISNIKFKEENRRKGKFKEIILTLEEKNFPVIVNDIINPIVDDFLNKRGWVEFKYLKNGGWTKSRIRK